MASPNTSRSIMTMPKAPHGGGHLLGYGAGLLRCWPSSFAGGGTHQPGLFGHTHYQGLVRPVALVQMGIARQTCCWR